MPRLKLIIAYDGTPFGGWQSQRHGNTIQDHIERAFAIVSGQRVRIHAAGRTDAGVHALAQCAHVDLNKLYMAADRWPRALNASLPRTIRVTRSWFVSEKFHARYSAKGKIYRYRIWAGPVLPPCEFHRAWHVAAPVDCERLKSAAMKFPGRHDFAAFAANRGKPESNTTRSVRSTRVRRKGPLIEIDFEADGFLYKMVRLMVGAIVEVARGRKDAEEISKRLHSPKCSGARLAAPADGLFLTRVRY